MLSLVKKLLASGKIRYLVAGGCTTFVNLITFFGLRVLTSIERNVCNVIAIAVAITFAYFANKFFVFRSETKGFYKTFSEALTFLGGRFISMGVEVLGFAILCDSFRWGELASKICVQFVVFVLNYIFSKVFVFNKTRKSFKENVKEYYCYYVSFGIVTILMIGICIAQEIVPFGTHSLTIVDSVHQYVPFFSELRNKLLNEGSLFYTWNVAMGSNFVSLSAYYLNSPFNYLILLFSKENIAMGMCFLIILKVALSSTTMAYFLSNKGGRKAKEPFIIGIAVAYALSNYVVGYCWNIMWLDCIMVFPLVVLGFEKLMEEKDPRLYTVSLFYCLYCNYYIGFMICVFLVLWFFVHNHKGIKAFVFNGLRFALYSLVAGGLTAFSLIPAYFGIMSTAAGKTKLPLWEWYGDIFVMLRQQLFLTDPITNQNFDGGVNLYCGMFAIVAMFLYVLTINRKPFQHIKKILLLVLLVISFNNILPNYIWHAFHDQYGIPNRFSFLFIFVLLGIAYDELVEIKNTKLYKIILAGIFAIAYVIYIRHRMGEELSNVITLGGILLIAIYVMWCIMANRKEIKQWEFAIGITAVMCIELIINGASGFIENGYTDLAGKYDTTTQVEAAYQTIQDMAKEDEAGFYRAELVDSTVLDEATWHNLPSVGTFCSTVLGEMVTTMGRMGFYTGANEFLYMGSTPFTNSIFNVRYLMEREGDYNNFDFEYVDTVESVGIYENPYPLSIAFCVNDETLNWNRDAWKQINGQNNLAMCMVGEGNIFKLISVDKIISSDDGEITSTSGGYMKFVPDGSGEASFIVSFFVEEPGDYYLNCRGNYITEITFYVDGEKLTRDRYQGQIFHLGELEEDQYVSIEYYYRSVTAGVSQSPYLGTALYDKEAYENIHHQLSNNTMQVDEMDDGYIKGSIDVPSDNIVFTSVPYDEGWKVYVDGKESKYVKVCGSFIALELEPGHHEIEMIYTPKGLYLGIVISLGAMVIFMLGVMYNNIQNRKKNTVKNDNTELTED